MLLIALGAPACGGSDESVDEGGDGSPPSTSNPAAAASGQAASASASASASADAPIGRAPAPTFEHLPVIFPRRDQRQKKGMRIHMRRRDAAKAGWTTEVLADAAEPVLQSFFDDLLTDAAGLTSSLDPAWQGATALVPSRLEVDFDDGSLSVLRGADLDDRLLGRQQLPALAQGLLERYAAHEPAGAEGEPDPGAIETAVDIVGIQADGARFETRARVQLARRGPAPMQHTLELRADWLAEDLETPRLMSLRLEHFEEVRAVAPLFADVTTHALGDTPRYELDILRGVDEHLGRTDRAGGFALQGMQGVAVGDVDGDGVDDLYICQQVGLPNQLLLGGKDGKFIDVGRRSKADFLDLTRAALIIDWENDGDQDLVLAMGISIFLFLNDGTGVFTKPSLFRAVGGAHFYNLSAADADGDGDLDLYGGRYSLGGVMHGAPAPYHDAFNGAANYYIRNDGPGMLVDATEESGLGVRNTKFTLASVWDDFDGDGAVDLYVVNDFGRNNLFLNDGSGHFVDVADAAGATDIGAGMGATAADFDLDGDVDLYVTNMWSAPGQRIVEQSDKFMGGEHRDLHPWYVKHASGNTLLANRGDGTFEDVTQEVGGGLGRWAWGGKFVDFDNDAYPDLYVPCGQTTRKGATYDLNGFFWRGVISLTPPDGNAAETYNDAFSAIHYMLMHENVHWNGLEPNVSYQNLGGKRFVDVSVVCGTDFVGDGRAMAVLDWDDDGRQDMLVKSRTAPRLRVMHNRSRSGHGFVSFELIGVDCNRDAIGARVVLQAGGRTLTKRIHAGDGYVSQSSKRLHFGLAGAEQVERATVEWPDGSTDTYEGLAVGTRYRIVQGSEAPVPVSTEREWSVRTEELPSRPPQPSQRPVTRLPLSIALPMRPFPVPSREQPERRIADFAGAPLIIHFWTAGDPSGAAGLAELALAEPAIRQSGARTVALSVDQGPYLARARKAAVDAGLEPGYADGRTLAVYEVFALEVLDAIVDVPLPLTLVLDARGRLAVVYCGLPFAEDLSRDLALIVQEDSASVIELRGGRQVKPNKRRLALMGNIFKTQGAEELARYYAELSAKRD